MLNEVKDPRQPRCQAEPYIYSSGLVKMLRPAQHDTVRRLYRIPRVTLSGRIAGRRVSR